MSPYRLIYGKACHLPFEIQHKSAWTIQKCVLDTNYCGRKRFLDLNELYEYLDDKFKNKEEKNGFIVAEEFSDSIDLNDLNSHNSYNLNIGPFDFTSNYGIWALKAKNLGILVDEVTEKRYKIPEDSERHIDEDLHIKEITSRIYVRKEYIDLVKIIEEIKNDLL